MQRQYFECIMNGGICARGVLTESFQGLACQFSAEVYFHILHSRNSHLQQQFLSTYAHTAVCRYVHM